MNLHDAKVNFRITLVVGATPVTKSAYSLAPTEMQELSDQLNEPFSNGFIRTSFSHWGSPVWFVKKKDRLVSMCFD